MPLDERETGEWKIWVKTQHSKNEDLKEKKISKNERLKAGGEGDDRGLGGSMVSPTQRTGVWANSGIWWRTGKTGVLQFMGSQNIAHDWVTEQQYSDSYNLFRAILICDFISPFFFLQYIILLKFIYLF